MPATEKDVGITQCLGTHKPFRAIVKQSVDDFVVNEILLDGTVARITTFPKHAAPNFPQKRPPPTASKEESAEEKPPAQIPYQQLDDLFPDQPPKSVSEAVQKFVKEDQTQLTLPASNTKEDRTKVHQWVRQNIPTYVTDTVPSDDNPDIKCVRLRKKASCKPWTSRKEPRLSRSGDRKRNADGPEKPSSDAHNDDTFDPRENQTAQSRQKYNTKDTVSFVLWKRNRDTNVALKTLSDILRKPVSAFTYAGTKDRRAVTTQLVHVRGVSEQRLARVNSVTASANGSSKSLMVGNFQILPKSAQPLRLGDLKGNRFTLTLRDVDISTPQKKENIQTALDSLRHVGFVNYFGLQRFGSGVSPTHETGFSFLRGDFEDVCRRLLIPAVIETRPGETVRPERQKLINSLKKFGERELSARQLLSELPPWMNVERTIVSSYVHDEKRDVKKYDHCAAFGKLPRNMRRMYGHAVQSYLWNLMASERIKQCCVDDSMQLHAIEGDFVQKGERRSRDLSYETKIHRVTQEEERNKSIPLYKVLIPVPGSSIPVPDVPYGNAAKKVLEREKIDIQDHSSSEYGLKGTYRWLIAKPEDFESRFFSYTTSRSNADCDAGLPEKSRATPPEVAEEENRATEQQEAVPNGDGQVDMDIDDVNKSSVAGDGDRKERSDDKGEGNCGKSAEVEEKKDVRDGQGSNCNTGEDVDANQKDVEDPLDTNKVEKVDVKAVQENEKAETVQESRHALEICFNLGCAEYATMLVRELTMMDSSTANQKTMQDMTCSS